MAAQTLTPTEAGVEVGTVFYSSWGYDQTNVDFYEVVALTPKAVKIVKVPSVRVSSGNHGTQEVVPGKANPDAKPMLKRLHDVGYGAQGVRAGLNISSYAGAWVYDGTPKSETASGWGH